jgi:hypothetical protein
MSGTGILWMKMLLITERSELQIKLNFICLGYIVLLQTRDTCKWMPVFFGTWRYFRAVWVLTKEVFSGPLTTQEQNLDPGQTADISAILPVIYITWTREIGQSLKILFVQAPISTGLISDFPIFCMFVFLTQVQ